jgi:hypothetical protein
MLARIFFHRLKLIFFICFSSWRLYASADFDRVHQKVMDLLLQGRDKFYYAKLDIQVSGSSPQVIHLPEGGGSLDLFQIMSTGEYRLGFVLPSFYEDVQNLRVFYLARYRPEKVRDFQFGSSCFQLLELTEFAKKHLLVDSGRSLGLVLNREAVKNLLAVAGDWYISFESLGDLYLTKVSLTLGHNKKWQECSP